MTGMTLELTTEQLQLIVIALALFTCSSGSFEQEHKTQFDELADVFAELNSLCRKENNYRLTLDVFA